MTTPTLDLEAMADYVTNRLLSALPTMFDWTKPEIRSFILSALREVASSFQRNIEYWKSNSEQSDAELCKLESALGFRECLDFKEGLTNPNEKAIERIRDLIAKEGELGDLKEELTRLTELVEKLKKFTRHDPSECSAFGLAEAAPEKYCKCGLYQLLNESMNREPKQKWINEPVRINSFMSEEGEMRYCLVYSDGELCAGFGKSAQEIINDFMRVPGAAAFERKFDRVRE